MTSSHTQSQTHATHRLRLVLRANALFSIATGLTALTVGSRLSEELGIDHVLFTRILGAGLVGFGALVLAIARSSDAQLLREALLVSAADAAWVIGTVGVLLGGILTGTGNVVAILVGIGVADFAAMQIWFRSHAAAGYRQSVRGATA